ncbi:MAG: hydroxymethylglutaryl-CoA lyase [Maricaulaceae bacterium]
MRADRVELVEVSPRDGLQNEPEIVDTQTKITLIERAIAAGVRRIETASFVHPGRVPQMADAEAVMAGLPERTAEVVTYIGLVLNKRGALRALDTQVHELGAVAVASDGFGRANQGQTSAETVKTAMEIVALAQAQGRTAQVTLSTAFGCPFDGEVDPDRVLAIVAELAQCRPREIALADTIGVAVPAQVAALFERARAVAGDITFRAHFHNTRNTGVANVWAAIQAGASVVDASIAGLGGCPFAPKATGNVPTEDVLYMLDRSGVTTGVTLDPIIETAAWLSDRLGRDLPGMVSRAGGFPPQLRGAI